MSSSRRAHLELDGVAYDNAAKAASEIIDFKPDTSPIAVLGLRFVNQPPANPPPGTSRELQSGVWLALDGVYFAGGHTTLNGVKSDNEQQSTRVGFTLAVPVDRQNFLKLRASTLSDEVSQARFLAFRFGQRRNTSNTLGDPRTRWEQMDALAVRRVLRVFPCSRLT